LRRKFIAKGSTIMKQKRAPIKKRNDVVTIKGSAYLFSLSRRPGEINLHISKKMRGELIINALIKAIFMCIQRASAGARNTRLIPGLSEGIKDMYGL